MSYFVRAGVISGLPELVNEFGMDLNSLLRSLDLPEKEALFDNEETLIDITAAQDLLELAAERCLCPYLGLLLGSRQTVSFLGVVGLLMQSASNLEAAIRESIQHLNVHAQGVLWSLEVEGDIAITKTGLVSDLGTIPKQALDLSLAQTANLLRLLSGNQLQLSEVHFHYDLPAERWIYRQVFGAPIRFNAEFDGLVFPARYLKQPMPTKNDYLHDTLSRYVSESTVAEPGDLASQVKLVIRQLLPTGSCSILNTAGFFNCDKRTLQRRLKREGLVYHDLVDEERYNQALSYLKDSKVPLTTIADLVGFADISTFSRSFKQRFGMSPSEWRKQQAVD